MFTKLDPTRPILLLNIFLVIPLGYVIRFSHVLPEYIRHIGGSLAYEILWILVGAFLFSRANRRRIAIWVFLLTCGIEFLKLYQAPWIQAIRGTLAGRLVLATTFDRSNFPVYLLGSYLGWLWIRFLDRRLQQRFSSQ
jgi:glycopeptide antibiotics resistance protein